jgi:cell division septum initiation protein DivIVA
MVYTALDKQDLELLIEAYNELLVRTTDKLRLEELAKEAYHDEARPVVKKLAKFVSFWEEINEQELLEAAQEKANPTTEAARAITRTVIGM